MDDWSAARALLPLWVRAFPWLIGPLFGLLGYLATRVVLRVPAPRATADGQPEPWWERARIIYPRRLAALSFQLLLVLGAWVLGWCTASSWVEEAFTVRLLFTIISAWAGAWWAGLRFEAQHRGVAVRAALRAWAARAMGLYAAPYALLLLLALTAALPGGAGMLAAAASVVVVVWLSSGGGLLLARAVGLARVAPARVQAAVHRASSRLKVPCREVLELDALAVNATAFPLMRRVAFTRTAAEALDDEELEAVAAHELGHLAEPWTVRWVRPALLSAGAVATFFLHRVTVSPRVAWGVVVGALALVLVARRVARRGEQHADGFAKDDTGVYARSLEKVYRLNLVPAVLRRPGAHGHLYDRLVASGHPPAWPRPARPEPAPLGMRLLVALAVVVPLTAVLWAHDTRPQDAAHARWALAWGSPSPWAVEVLAREAAQAQRLEEALVWYRTARSLAPQEPFLTGALVVALGNTGRCTEAKAELDQLEVYAKELSLREDEDDALTLAREAIQSCLPLPARGERAGFGGP